MSIEVDLKFNSGGASMKLFLLLMFGVLCRGNLLDRGYLPPPGAKTSGGSPGAIDVPLETPLETPKSGAQPRPIEGSLTERFNVRPEGQNAYATTPSGFDSEAIFSSVQPGSVNLPTTTQTSFAFTQTTTYSPLQDTQCNGSECGSDYRFPASLPDKSYGVRPGPILSSPSASNAPQKTGNVPGSILPFQPISDFGSTTQSAQAFQPFGSTSQPSQILGHLQTTTGSDFPRDQTFKPGTGSRNYQTPNRGYEPGRDGFKDITSSSQYPSAQENYVNNLPSTSVPQPGQSSLAISGSKVPANEGYQPDKIKGDSFTPSGQYPVTQENLPIPSASNIPDLFSPTTSPNFSNQPTLGIQPLTPSTVPNVPAHFDPLAGFPSTSARDFASGRPNQYTPSVLSPGSVIRPGAPAFDPNAPSRFGSIGEAQRYHKPSLDNNATILNYDNFITPEGYFSYNFDTSNGIHADEAGDASDGVKAEGSYSYTGDDGQFYRVTYTADENGYQPKGDHLPTPPPIPEAIQRVIEQSIRNQAAGIVPDPGFYDEEKYGYKKYHDKPGQDYQAPNRRGPNTQDGGAGRNKQVLPGRKPTSDFEIPSEISRVNVGRVPQTDESIKQDTPRPSYDNKYRIPGQGISDKVISQKPANYLPDTNLGKNAQKVPYDIQRIPSTTDPFRGPEASIPRGQFTPVTGTSDQIGLDISPDKELTNLNQSPTSSGSKIYEISRTPSQNGRPSGEEYNQFELKSSTPTDQNPPDNSYINGVRPSGKDVFGRPISQKINPLPGTESIPADRTTFEPIVDNRQDGRVYENRFTIPARGPISHEDNTDSEKPGTTFIPTSTGVFPQRQETSASVIPSGESRTFSGYQYNVPAQRLNTKENPNQGYQPGKFSSSVRRPIAGGIPENIEGASTVIPSTFSPMVNAYPSAVGLIGNDVTTKPGSTRKTGRPSPGSIELFNVTPDHFSSTETVKDYEHPIDGAISTLRPGTTTRGNIKYNQDRLTTITPPQVDSATQRLPLDDIENKQSQETFPHQYSTSTPSSPGLGQQTMVPKEYPTSELDQSQFPSIQYTPRGNDSLKYTHPDTYGTEEPFEPIRSIFDEIGIPKGESIFKSQPKPGGQLELSSKQPFQSPGQQIATDGPSRFESTRKPDDQSTYQENIPQRGYTDATGTTRRPGFSDVQGTSYKPGYIDSRYTTLKPEYTDTQGATFRPGHPNVKGTSSKPEYQDSRYITTRPGYTDGQDIATGSIDFRQNISRPRYPDAQGTKSKPEYIDTRYTTGRPGYSDVHGTTAKPRYPDAQGTTSRPGYPDTRYTTGRPGYLDTRYTTARPAYPDAQGTSSRPVYTDEQGTTARSEYPDARYTTSRPTTSRSRYHDMRYTTDKPGYPDAQDTTLRSGYSDEQVTTSRSGYPDTRYTTARPAYSDAQGTSSRPVYTDEQGATARSEYPDARYTTSRPTTLRSGYPDMRYTTDKPGYPDAQGTTLRPGYSDQQGTTSRSGYPDTRYTTARPAYPDAQGTSSIPVFTDEQGTTARSEYPDARYTTSRPGYLDERYTSVRPVYTYTKETPSRPEYHDSRYTTSRPRYPDEKFSASRPGYIDMRYTTSRHPDTQGTTLIPEYPDAQGTTSRPRYPDERYTTSRLGYPIAQGTSPRPGYPGMRYTTSRPGYPDKPYYSPVPSSVGQTQPQQYQGLDRQSTGVPDEERKDHGLFEPMIEQKLQGELPQIPGQFGSKISTFPKVKGEVFSPSRQPPRYDPETGYHY